MAFLEPEQRAGFDVLRRRLGWWEALRLGARVRWAVARGEPFEALPPAVDPRERGSRAQLGPAVVLYRLLRERGEARALALTGEAVEAGALAFLGESIGPVRRDLIAGMDAETRRAWVTKVGEKFPNATLDWDHVGPDEVCFRVTRCRFVELCRVVGEPALARFFCRGDGRFFGEVEADVSLERPHTIADDAPDCPFRIYWTEAPPPAGVHTPRP